MADAERGSPTQSASVYPRDAMGAVRPVRKRIRKKIDRPSHHRSRTLLAGSRVTAGAKRPYGALVGRFGTATALFGIGSRETRPADGPVLAKAPRARVGLATVLAGAAQAE